MTTEAKPTKLKLKEVVKKALAVLLFIVALPFMVVLSIVGSVLAFVLYHTFKKHMRPQTFVDIDRGYGIRQPHWSRQVVAVIGVTISGFIDIVLNPRGNPDYKSPFYRRSEGKFFVTDPSIYTDKVPEGPELENYYAERVSAVNNLIAYSGWRSVMLRYLIEMPTNNVIQNVVNIGTDSILKKRDQRETLFVVY